MGGLFFLLSLNGIKPYMLLCNMLFFLLIFAYISIYLHLLFKSCIVLLYLFPSLWTFVSSPQFSSHKECFHAHPSL